MTKLMANINNYSGFINVLFALLLGVIGYLLVDKLGGIESALKEIQALQVQQMIVNENVQHRLGAIETRVGKAESRIEKYHGEF